MFLNDITLQTKVYSLTAQRATSSVRSDASQPLSEPNTITISHENVSSGRRNTVVILEDLKVINLTNSVINDSVKMMFKLSYNPFGGRTTTAADLEALRLQMVEFINTPANFTKLLNQES